MEPTFRWSKYHVLVAGPNRGKVTLVATVPVTGFEIECNVTPNSNGHLYDWTFYPRVFVRPSKWIHLYEQRVNRLSAFTELLDAKADVERIVCGEIAESLAGKPSIFDLWWPAVVSAIRGEQRVW